MVASILVLIGVVSVYKTSPAILQLTADKAHRSRGRDETRIVDEVTRFLFHYYRADEVDDLIS